MQVIPTTADMANMFKTADPALIKQDAIAEEAFATITKLLESGDMDDTYIIDPAEYVFDEDEFLKSISFIEESISIQNHNRNLPKDEPRRQCGTMADGIAMINAWITFCSVIGHLAFDHTYDKEMLDAGNYSKLMASVKVNTSFMNRVMEMTDHKFRIEMTPGVAPFPSWLPTLNITNIKTGEWAEITGGFIDSAWWLSCSCLLRSRWSELNLENSNKQLDGEQTVLDDEDMNHILGIDPV